MSGCPGSQVPAGLHRPPASAADSGPSTAPVPGALCSRLNVEPGCALAPHTAHSAVSPPSVNPADEHLRPVASISTLQLRSNSGLRLDSSAQVAAEASTSGSDSSSPGAAVAASSSAPREGALRRVLRTLSYRASAAGDAGTEGETPAAAAERHRLAHATGLDAQSVWLWVEKALPFFCLLGALFVYSHLVGLSTFIYLTAVLKTANDYMRQQVALKDQLQPLALLWVILGAALHLASVLYLFRHEQLWHNFLLFAPHAVTSVWDAFFRVTVCDALARLGCTIVKASIVLLWRRAPEDGYRRRGQALTLAEYVALFYRSLMSTTVWYEFFEDSHLGSWLASACTGLYLVFKCGMVFERLTLVVAAAKALLRAEAVYGSYAKPEDVAEAGNQCAICVEQMRNPIKLACSHLFCEHCIAEWFERERTCPMCRAPVRPAGLVPHTDGTTSLLPQLF